MVDLVGVASGLLPYAQAEILLRRGTRAGVLNLRLVAVKLDVSEVELRSVRDRWIAGGVALGKKLETPHSNNRGAGPTRRAALATSQARECSQSHRILRIRQKLLNCQRTRLISQSTRACSRG